MKMFVVIPVARLRVNGWSILMLIWHHNYFANESEHKNEFPGNVALTLCPCKYHDQESCHATNTLIFH